MAADDLIGQLAARQQAYRLLRRDRDHWATWMQRLLAGATPSPVTPPAGDTGTPPAPAGGAALNQRSEALKRLLQMIQQHSAEYANDPQMKATLDGVMQRMQSRIQAMDSGQQPFGGQGWGQWLRSLTGQPAAAPAAAAGTPQAPGTGLAAAAAAVPTAMAAEAPPTTPPVVPPAPGQGATGWLGDVSGGLTTPVTPPGLGNATPPVTPANPAAGGGGGGGGGGGYEGPPAGWSSTDGGPWQPPAEEEAAPNQPVNPPGSSPAELAAAAAAKANADKYLAAAKTDFQYEANLRNAANSATTAAQRALYTAQADKYNERGQRYISYVPGATYNK